MPPMQTVLFDLDGTLIDSVQLILESYRHTLAAHGLPPLSAAAVPDTGGTAIHVMGLSPPASLAGRPRTQARSPTRSPRARAHRSASWSIASTVQRAVTARS